MIVLLTLEITQLEPGQRKRSREILASNKASGLLYRATATCPPAYVLHLFNLNDLI